MKEDFLIHLGSISKKKYFGHNLDFRDSLVNKRRISAKCYEKQSGTYVSVAQKYTLDLATVILEIYPIIFTVIG